MRKAVGWMKFLRDASEAIRYLKAKKLNLKFNPSGIPTAASNSVEIAIMAWKREYSINNAHMKHAAFWNKYTTFLNLLHITSGRLCMCFPTGYASGKQFEARFSIHSPK